MENRLKDHMEHWYARMRLNLLGLAAAVLLVALSLMLLLRMQDYAVRASCYQQGLGACATADSGHPLRYQE